jgi:hypothetical protein
MIWVTSLAKALLGKFTVVLPRARHPLMNSVVTKGIEIATKRHIALKKLITHNARDGVSIQIERVEFC